MAWAVPPGKELAFFPTQFLKERASARTQGIEKSKELDFRFCLEEVARLAPPFYDSDAPIYPRSKVRRRAMAPLCFAFCWPKRVDEAARFTGFSDRTVKDVYLALRDLLFDPRYRKWHVFDRQDYFQTSTHYDGPKWAGLWNAYAECYLDQECQRAFLYGRRKKRQCAQCQALDDPDVLDNTTEEYRQHWLRMVDETRYFYLNRLGIRHERWYDAEIFQKRVYHQQVISLARYHSRTTKNGIHTVNHLKRGSSTVIDLWQTLLKHIAEYGGLDEAAIGAARNLRQGWSGRLPRRRGGRATRS